MALNVGNVCRVIVDWRDTRFEGVFRNVLNFRVTVGELAVTQQPALIDAIASDWIAPWYPNLAVATYLHRVRVYNVSNLNDPADEKTYGIGEKNGDLANNDDDVPQAAACIVRQAHFRGRKSLGRIFFGPLPSFFASQGRLVVDPLGAGDLVDVLNGVGEDVSVGNWKMRPCVVGQKETVVAQKNEIRTNRFSRLVVYHKTRRAGIGE